MKELATEQNTRLEPYLSLVKMFFLQKSPNALETGMKSLLYMPAKRAKVHQQKTLLEDLLLQNCPF